MTDGKTSVRNTTGHQYHQFIVFGISDILCVLQGNGLIH